MIVQLKMRPKKEEEKIKPDAQLDYIETKSINYLYAHFEELDPKDKIILARMFLTRRMNKRIKAGDSNQLDAIDELSNRIRDEHNNGGNGNGVRV
jgi:hypothetical protein